MLSILSLAHTHKQQETKGQHQKMTSTHHLSELWSMIGASTVIVKIGIIPQTSSLYDHDTWTITKFIRLDTQGFTQM